MLARKGSRPAGALVSVVIPVEPQGDPGPALRALKAVWPKGWRGEALVARGRHPSLQRNAAVGLAKGSLIYFLDSDSLVQPGAVEALALELADAAVAVAGGPNLARLDEPWLGLVFSQVLASRLGSGASRARYAPVGAARESSEKELILCNLMLRRSAYMDAGGLREDLYPNEENELLNRLEGSGWRLRYQPLARVRRPRRGSVMAFAWQALRYGRGRMQQMRVNFRSSDLVQLAPLGLLSYILALPFLANAGPLVSAPLVLYLGATAMSSVGSALSMRDARAFPLAWALIVLRHLAYGAGLALGLVQGPLPGSSEVRIARFSLGRQR